MSNTFDIDDIKRFVKQTGIPVFPCQADKSPWQGFLWKTEAFTDLRKIDIEYHRTGATLWGAAVGNVGVMVIDADVDPAKGADGVTVLRRLEEAHGVKITDKGSLTVNTPRGGQHIYLRGNAKSKNGLFDGVDRKAQGGYVIAPGSVRADGARYEKTSLDWRIKAASDAEMRVFGGDGAPGAATKERLDRPSDAEIIGSIPDGKRDTELTRWAGVLRGQGLTVGEMDAALWAMNLARCNPPMDREQVSKIAASIGQKPRGDAGREAAVLSEFDALDAEISAAVAPESGLPLPSRSLATVDPDAIPVRDWILRDRLLKGFLSVLVAPGGVGKSTVAMAEALAISTGRSEICGFEVVKSGPVLYINTEDPDDELDRRFSALAKVNGLDVADLGNLHIMSARTAPLVFAAEKDGRVVVNQKAVDKLVEHCKALGIVAVFLDPYIRLHRTRENDNNAADIVAQTLQKVIDRAGVALCVVHHTRKVAPGQSESGVEDARGAKALTDAARVVYGLRPMQEKEAADLGIAKSDAPWYLRLDPTKTNLTAPAKYAKWYKRESVILPNGEIIGAVRYVADLSDRFTDLDDGGRATKRAVLGAICDRVFAAADFPGGLPIKRIIDDMTSDERDTLLGGDHNPTRRIAALVALLDTAIETRCGEYNYLAGRGKDRHSVARL